MFKTIVNAFKVKDIRIKIIMTLVLILVYRIGCFIPTPGLDIATVKEVMDQQSGDGLIGVISAVSGGALSQGAILALGIVPFINASIIMQLLAIVIPGLERLSKEGEEGRKKINVYTRYLAILLAAIQAVGIVLTWKTALKPTFGSVVLTGFIVGIILIAGSSLTMWIGERMTEYGIGNGTSLLIFIGILSTAGVAIWNSIYYMSSATIVSFVVFIVLVILVFGFIVWLDLAERKIPVQYAKQVKGNKMYGGQSTFIPIKVMSGGVMPIIFASAMLMFPQMIASFWPESGFYKWWAQYMGAGSIVYCIVMPLLIILFAFFYAQMQFNPDDVARNIQQYGGFIPGIRPGRPTADYLKKINNRITLFGAIFLAIIALIPGVLFAAVDVGGTLTGAFTATGLMIVVSVALEFDKALQQQLMMKQYKGFLK